MRILSGFLVILFVLAFISGCQRQQQTNSSVTKYDRLVANENLRLKNELSDCREEIKKQLQAVEDCRREKIADAKQAGENVSFLMEQLPEEMLNEVTRLTEENAELKKKIAQLEGGGK